jgi:hypothetical protein
MKRVLALAVACLLVAGALAVRAALASDDDGDGTDDDSSGGGLVIACVPELAQACEALDRDVAELRIEDPEDTIADPDVDAWVTLDPWPAIAATATRRDPFPRDTAVPVAQTDLVLIVREEQVPGGCDPVAWTCLVDELGDNVAVDPDSGSGLLVLGFAAADLHGGEGLASNDFDDPDFRRRLDALDIGRDPLADIRVGLPEPVATGALAVQLERLGTRRDTLVEAPGPFPATVAVVVAGREADRVAGEPSFTAALGELGWDLRTDAATTGLPSPGVLFALSREV